MGRHSIVTAPDRRLPVDPPAAGDGDRRQPADNGQDLVTAVPDPASGDHPVGEQQARDNLAVARDYVDTGPV